MMFATQKKTPLNTTSGMADFESYINAKATNELKPALKTIITTIRTDKF